MAPLSNVHNHHRNCNLGQKQAENVEDIGRVFALPSSLVSIYLAAFRCMYQSASSIEMPDVTYLENTLNLSVVKLGLGLAKTSIALHNIDDVLDTGRSLLIATLSAGAEIGQGFKLTDAPMAI